MSGRYAQIEAAVKCSAIYQDLKTSKTYVDGWQSTIYKAYFSGLCQGISPQNMAKKCQKYGTFTYLHLLDPEDLPLISFPTQRIYHLVFRAMIFILFDLNIPDES